MEKIIREFETFTFDELAPEVKKQVLTKDIEFLLCYTKVESLPLCVQNTLKDFRNTTNPLDLCDYLYKGCYDHFVEQARKAHYLKDGTYYNPKKGDLAIALE